MVMGEEDLRINYIAQPECASLGQSVKAIWEIGMGCSAMELSVKNSE